MPFAASAPGVLRAVPVFEQLAGTAA